MRSPMTSAISIPSRREMMMDSIICYRRLYSFPRCAFGACPEYLEGGTSLGKFLLFANFPLDLFEAVADELDDVSASEAYEMIVPRASECFLKTRMVFPEPVPRNQPAVDEQVKRIIYGRPRDLQ